MPGGGVWAAKYQGNLRWLPLCPGVMLELPQCSGVVLKQPEWLRSDGWDSLVAWDAMG